MLLKDKDYVYAVYRERSFSRAAKGLYISQPALSAAVQRVEKQVGVPLFDRKTSPISLTPAGEYYIRSVERVLEIEREMEAQFSAMCGRTSGTVSIGGSAFFCAHVLPGIAEGFQARFPGCSLELAEASASAVMEQLQAGTLDFAVGAEQPDSALIDARPIGREELVLAVPRDFTVNETLAHFRLSFDDVRRVSPADDAFPAVEAARFRDQPFLLLKEGNDSLSRLLLMCRDAGFSPNAVMHLDQLLTAYYVACGGKGIALVRSGITRYVEPTQRLYFYRINHPAAQRDILLYSRHGKALSFAARSFRSYLSDVGLSF